MLKPSILLRIVKTLNKTPIALIVFATLLNIMVIVIDFQPERIEPKRQDQRNEERRDAEHQETNQVGFWPFVFSHISDFSTVFIAIFNGFLVYVTYSLVISTNKLWASAAEQSRLTQKSIDLARSEFIASHRPRLRFRYALLTQFIPGQRGIIKVCIGNVGETVAIPREMGADVFIRSPGYAVMVDARPKEWTQYTAIPAGKEITIELQTPFPLTVEQFNGIQAETDKLCMLMVLNYVDESGIERSTSIFKICVPLVRRFRKCHPDDEYAEWDYED